MRVTIHLHTNLPTGAFLARAVAGLIATNPEAEELIEALCDVTERNGQGVSDRVVASVYRDCNGNVSETARMLGLARSTVRARMARIHNPRPLKAANDTE